MKSLSQSSARYLILMVAGVYIVLLGLVEGGRHLHVIDTFSADDALRQVTTLASLSVGAIIGFYLASRQRQS